MRNTELTTLNHLFKSHWLLSRSEQERFRDIVLKWKRVNRDASIFHEMLVESLVRLHLMEQRLVNQSQFFFGEQSDYRYIRESRTGDISTEDAQQKKREFDLYYWQVVKHKTELLKLAMANSINLNITENGSVHSLFSALSTTERDKISNYKGSNGRSVARDFNGETETD